MNWMRKWGCITKRFKCSSSDCTEIKDNSQIMHAMKRFSALQRTGGYLPKGNTLFGVKLPSSHVENAMGCKTYTICSYRRYTHSVQNDSDLSRDLLVRLWVADRKKLKPAPKRNHRVGPPLVRLFSGESIVNEKSNGNIMSPPTQPPTSQSVTGILEPISLEEAKIAPLLARSNLLITRDIEWANLTLGIEQENRYAVVDVCYPQSPVGFIREQSNWIMRQFLRLRRPFIASITDALGNEIFRVRRPFWWITSSIYTEINGKEIGVVHRRWHLWRRIYELYLGNKQFAVVENGGFWFWTFTLKDIDGNVLAEIDRDWRGFGFELFTDAGQYVVRFGSSNPDVAPPVGVKELDVNRPLSLSERAVAVALAISLDNDYFSRHGGWGMPYLLDHD